MPPHPYESNSDSLIQANTGDAVAIFTGYDLSPGKIRAGEVKLVVRDAESRRLRLFETHASNDFALGELVLTIHLLGSGHSLYRGELGGVSAEGLELGKLASGDEPTLRFVVRLSPDADPDPRRGAGAVYEWPAAGREPR
jgi:hypothetical protein